jgi:ABC-type sulfate/molybdate transport systems ATPase subunit
VSRLQVNVRRRVPGFELEVALEVGEAPVAVVGPNGAGKSTLLLSILGERPVDEGQVLLDGQRLLDRGVDVPPEDRRIAYVPQDYALFPHLTAAANVAFALACRKVPTRERPARARVILERLGALAFAERRPATLSGGERQRVALARALATEPRALLFDEPFAALDVEARDEVRAYLRARLGELRLPALIVTHERADVEALGAAVVVLEAGRVVQRGALAELEANPASPWVARFCAPRR